MDLAQENRGQGAGDLSGSESASQHCLLCSLSPSSSLRGEATQGRQGRRELVPRPWPLGRGWAEKGAGLGAPSLALLPAFTLLLH